MKARQLGWEPNTHRHHRSLKRRILFMLCCCLTIIVGLASRRYREPSFLAEYSGDTLWALMLYLLVSVLLAGRPIASRAVISLALAFLVEISQLYHAPGSTAFGRRRSADWCSASDFSWTDLVCYAVGIAVGAVTEWGIGRVTGPKLESVSSDSGSQTLC